MVGRGKPLSSCNLLSRRRAATVNLKPLVEGHVLVLPKRCIDRLMIMCEALCKHSIIFIGDCLHRFNLLNDDEVTDLWRSVHRVSRALEGHYKCRTVR